LVPPPVRRLEAHRDRLLAIKHGDLPWAEVDAWRKELHADFERALTETQLPERPDYEVANRFLIRARKETAKIYEH
jgi:BMFP domain-containing protein YqiC